MVFQHDMPCQPSNADSQKVKNNKKVKRKNKKKRIKADKRKDYITTKKETSKKDFEKKNIQNTFSK